MAKISDADIELIGSGGGVFNIDVDGHRTYCKSNTGRFPTDDEILNGISEKEEFSPIRNSAFSRRIVHNRITRQPK